MSLQTSAPFKPKRSHITIPDGALDAWYTAKAAAGAGSQQATVCVLGDSITQGMYATLWSANSWYGKLRTLLQSLYGNAGSYWGVVESTAFNTSIPAGDVQWTFTGTAWGAFNMIGPMGFVNGVTTDKATFTSLEAFQDFDLHLVQNPNGAALTVKVDTVTQAGSPTCLNATWTRHAVVSYAGFTHATHVVDVALAGNGYEMVGGITTYPTGRSTPGIIMTKLARTGYLSSVFTPQFPNLQPNYAPAKASVEDFSPSLALIAFGVNDCNNYMGLDLYRWNLILACQSAQQAGASIVLLGQYNGSGNANNRAYGQYLAAMREVAHGYNAVFVDVHTAFGSGAGLLNVDNVHPNDAGHLIISNLLASFL